MMEDMKIGEIRELEGKKYKCVEYSSLDFDDCLSCCFNDEANIYCNSSVLGECSAEEREDETDVIFKEVE